MYFAQQTLQPETKARHSRAVGLCEKLYESIARITALKYKHVLVVTTY